jgi:hypothetical protein
MPLATLRGVLGYAEGARAAAVRRAQAAGRYDRADPLLVAGEEQGRRRGTTWVHADGFPVAQFMADAFVTAIIAAGWSCCP